MAEPRSQQPVTEGRPRKRRRMGKDRAPPEPMRGGDRDNEFSEAYSFDDDYSDSRPPSPRRQAPRRRRRMMGRRRPDHGYPRSASFTPSCERRGPRRRPPPQHAPGGGERRRTHAGPPPGSGGGGGGRGVRRSQEDFGGDVDVALDRFIRVNRLQGRCEKDLRALSEKTAWQVMGCAGPGVGHTFELSGDIRDPTAVVLGRIRKAAEESGGREAGRKASGRGAREGPRGGGARRRNSRSRSRH